MLLDTIIRAWKDPEYRRNLSADEQALLPENPAGAIELTDDELEMATGGHSFSSNSSSNSSNSSSNSNSHRSSNKSWRRPSHRRSNSHRSSSKRHHRSHH
jgi:mersacidin/lichenicidin family type 2 lantibiotic